MLLAIYINDYFSIAAEKIFFLTAAAFAVIPDIDTVKSKAGKWLEPFSIVIGVFSKHRGIMHTALAAATTYLLMSTFFSKQIAAAALIGYSSHIILDAMTVAGVKLLYPFSKLKLHGFIRTNTMPEHILLLLFVAALVNRVI